ncbi:transmembrane GTPase fzo-1 [Magallana gigas]|uniref:transmembrane GTPase fzo-1 n=1 Tax=Magallana gigas TaxID=29159 RepID=UPI00333EBE26
MDTSIIDEEQTSSDYLESHEEPERRLLHNFENVLQLIQVDTFWNNVGETLENKYPRIIESLKDRMKDLQKHDCGIVVAGETSAGKSALINKLIGHETLAEGVLETTAKIYRVKHSAKIGAVKYRVGNSEPTEQFFNSVEELQQMLKNLESEDTRDNNIHLVDVLMPFSKIQNGNVTIVDTPGIGDSIELKKMLEEYISKAVAFIIVMDVSRAGGLQRDRVLSVLSTIELSASDMLCFDLEDTLFVRNKWDCIDAGRQTRDKLKMIITDRMRTELPWVRESQIFDTCLRKTTYMLSPADKSEYHSQFKQFEEAIHILIKKKENIRIQTHGRYLSCVVLEASKVLSEALTANQKEIDGNDITLQNFKEIMTKTMEAIETFHLNEEKMVMAIYGKIISSLYEYINSEEFSTLVLQKEPKLETFLKMKIDGIVHKRMERATKMWLDENVPKIVKTEFDLLIQDITDKYEEMSNICKSLEGISEPKFQYGIKEEGFFWTVASGIAWVGHNYFWSFFFGPQAVAIISTFWVVSTLSVGTLDITRHMYNAEEIIKESFTKRVKSMNKEKLHKLLQKNLGKGLREFHRQIVTIVLPNAIKNMSFCVDLLEKKKKKMEKKQDDFKHLQTKLDRCQNDVDKMITSVPQV